MPSKKRSSIYVVAGVNGAGKSSIHGAAIREAGSDYYNPDEAARAMMEIRPNLTQREANSAAWYKGVRLLRRAIDERLEFALETTLGGKTIPFMLHHAAAEGILIHIWYVGLANPELYVARVRKRVSQGGHNIPEEDILRRYVNSRLNLIDLLPALASLRLFDNSYEADPIQGIAPRPQLLLEMKKGKIVGKPKLTLIPVWAKPIVAAAIICDGRLF